MLFGVTRPGVAFLADTKGRGSPVGHTVMNDGAEASKSTVMFNSTEMASGGTVNERFGAGDVSGRSICPPAPSGPTAGTPTGPLFGGRVSSTRTGVMPTKPSGFGDGVACCRTGRA